MTCTRAVVVYPGGTKDVEVCYQSTLCLLCSTKSNPKMGTVTAFKR